MGHGSRTTLPLALAALCLGATAVHAEPAPPPPPFDVTGSAFAARLRDRVAEHLQRGPAHPRWFDTAAVPPEVVRTPRFVYVRDRALSLPAPPWFGEDAYTAAFELVRDAWASAEPDGARALLVFTTFDDGGGSLFYLPLANDVAGLGVGKPTELFDDTPGSALDGVAWLGDVERLEAAGDEYFREAFIHEIAHRWAAYVDVAHGGLPADALRGRQSMHWSFLASTGASPMEGNGWTVEDDGSWVTAYTRPLAFRFSPLDLYLMGVLPPEEVPPFELVTRFSVISPAGLDVQAATAPAHRLGAPVRLWVAEHEAIGIEEIIAANGPRVPPASAEPVVWPVGIVLLSNGLEKASFDELVRLDLRVADLVRDFTRATDGRVVLDVAVAGAGSGELGAPCAEVDACDRTRADRCAPIREGGEPVCTRTCQDDADCGPGFCCGALAVAGAPSASAAGSICLAGPGCTRPSTTPPPALDRPSDPAPEEAESGGGAVDEGTSSCSDLERDGGRALAGRSGPDAWSLALLLAALALARSRALRPAGARRGSRGSPG